MTPQNPLRRILAGLATALPALALSVPGTAQAALSITATEYHGRGPGFAVSSTDLVNTGSSALTGTTSSPDPIYGTSIDGAHDGIHPDNFPPSANQYAVSDGTTLTFDLGGSTTGYDISSIISLTGYSDSTDRISQKYNVEYRLVGSTDWNPLIGDMQGATVNREWVIGGGDLEYSGELQVTIADMNLTGVDGLRFTFYNYNAEAIYQEIDVTATVPEPSSLLVLGSLLGTWVCLRSRRR